MNKLLAATLAGAVTSFVLGFLIYGMALAGFFAANVGTATGVIKDPPDFLWLAVGQFPGALLLALVISKWGNATSLAGGAKVGAILGLLISLAVDLTMYGTTNVSNLTATLVDPIVSTVMLAGVGAVTGMVLGGGKSAA